LRVSRVTDVVGLLSEINDLKRVRVADFEGSLADRFFRSAWAAIVLGEPVLEVALRITAHVVASVRLGGIDRAVLNSAGLEAQAVTDVFLRSFRTVSAGLDPGLESQLAFELARGAVPEFVELLCRQPRAGATSPGKPRIIVLPTESHGDHCLVVAVYAVLLSSRFGAAADTVFLAALAHHLYNAYLPDSGFTGEEILAGHLGRVIASLRDRAAGQLSNDVQEKVLQALQATATADTSNGRAFHAADVIDRVLQMKWYEQAAGFKLGMAMEDLQLVHAGPVQGFHRTVLRDAGLW